jgi:hypothetical protein
MMSECRNYSNKVWGEINRSLQAQQEPILKEKEEKARILQEEIDKMTLLVADQDADIKSKQEYILKLEQDIKVRIAEIEAINNVRDYFNTPEFRQRVSEKKKKRKFDEYDEQQEEKLQDNRNAISTILNNDSRDEKMKQEESELLAKLKEVNLANSEYSKEIENINQRVKDAAVNEENPFSAFTKLQSDIEDVDNRQKVEELEQQAQVVAENVSVEPVVQTPSVDSSKVVETPTTESTSASQEVPANLSEPEEPKKKTSLSSLLNSAKNLKK